MNAVGQGFGGNCLAQTFWEPTQRELDALKHHDYVDEISRVDQIWAWLEKNHGQTLAVNAPHATIPERHTYSELAELISIAAKGFESFGIGSGDVVALFAENSPRWLIADQGIMRVGASDAVRGATAPTE